MDQHRNKLLQKKKITKPQAAAVMTSELYLGI
jgi:hypothetical protein